MVKKSTKTAGWVLASLMGIGLIFGEDEETPPKIADVQALYSKNIIQPKRELTTKPLEQFFSKKTKSEPKPVPVVVSKPNPEKIVSTSIKIKPIPELEINQIVIPPKPIPRPKKATQTQPKKEVQKLVVVSSANLITKPSPKKLNASILGAKFISKSKVNVRSKPTVKSSIVGKLSLNTKVSYISIKGRWYQVIMPRSKKNGWIREDLISDKKTKPKRFIPVVPKRTKRTGPTRSPYYGKCDCPYDRTRRGSRCGGRSAYSRPGGRSPRCYF